jgi:hypothetical protein
MLEGREYKEDSEGVEGVPQGREIAEVDGKIQRYLKEVGKC